MLPRGERQIFRQTDRQTPEVTEEGPVVRNVLHHEQRRLRVATGGGGGGGEFLDRQTNRGDRRKRRHHCRSEIGEEFTLSLDFLSSQMVTMVALTFAVSSDSLQPKHFFAHFVPEWCDERSKTNDRI